MAQVRAEDYTVPVRVKGHSGFAWDAVADARMVVPDSGVVFSDGRLSFVLLSTRLSHEELLRVAESLQP
jgi:hypothetical protein